ncbi:MAG TPA: type II toxin-antitoxin system RelE/ParE family toxin [Vicinamibacterales bacterium]|nr:type II toxin-antitoxin system RelE/ParE family toxin [Vicinamibacterales bacterium]
MAQFAVEFHPLAADEAEAAERWYRERNEIASARFQRELDRAVDLISERPDTGAPYLANTRRVLLRRFPFFVVYRVRGDNVQVIAVAHARRRPGYWRSR